MENKTYDITIVGGGPAGLYAAACAGMRHLKVLLIESSEILGGKLNTYPEKSIFDIPGFNEIKAKDLAVNLKTQMENYIEHIDIVFNEEVLDVRDGDGYQLQLKNSTINTKYVLVTNGSGKFNPRKLDCEGANLNRNIIYSFIDTSRFADKDVIVLGGGDSAVDFVLMLQGVAKKVYLIHRRSDFRAKDDSLAKISKNTSVLTPFDCTLVDGNVLTITNKDSGEAKKIPFDNMVVAYGALPSNDYFSKILTIDQKGIVVNEYYQTSKSSVYAIGDACYYPAKNKNISSAFGEASNVISLIANKLNPSKTGQYYSSIQLKK